MLQLKYSVEESCRRGEEWYTKGIREKVETSENLGKILVIDIETGEYEIDEDHLAAAHRAQAKHPDAELYALRIGYPAVTKIGGVLRPLRYGGPVTITRRP